MSDSLKSNNKRLIEKIDEELMQQYLKIFKLMRKINIKKNDKIPVEIIDNIYVGSIGAAMNKNALKDLKITHIIIAAKDLKEYFPEVCII